MSGGLAEKPKVQAFFFGFFIWLAFFETFLVVVTLAGCGNPVTRVSDMVWRRFNLIL